MSAHNQPPIAPEGDIREETDRLRVRDPAIGRFAESWKAQHRFFLRRSAGLGCLQGMNDEDLITIGQRIGYSDTPAELFGISRLDRRRHLYV